MGLSDFFRKKEVAPAQAEVAPQRGFFRKAIDKVMSFVSPQTAAEIQPQVAAPVTRAQPKPKLQPAARSEVQLAEQPKAQKAKPEKQSVNHFEVYVQALRAARETTRSIERLEMQRRHVARSVPQVKFLVANAATYQPGEAEHRAHEVDLWRKRDGDNLISNTKRKLQRLNTKAQQAKDALLQEAIAEKLREGCDAFWAEEYAKYELADAEFQLGLRAHQPVKPAPPTFEKEPGVLDWLRQLRDGFRNRIGDTYSPDCAGASA